MIAWLNQLNPAVLDGIWIVLVGACSAVSCALVGCYLVLRRMSLLGDAISHAVLPGLVLAFVLTGTRAPLPMFAGALACGVLTALLTQGVQRLGHVPEDSSMGVVFTGMFALGVVLINHYASMIDLDPGCVLYGLVEFVGLDTVPLGGLEVPRALLTLGPTLLAVIVFVTLLWKELKLSSFDPGLATTLGLGAGLLHYLLMAMVATVTVASFEAVGSILVVAMLIAPGATAHLLTDKLGHMLLIAAVMAALSALLGYLGAVWLNTSVAGMMTVAAGLQFALVALLAPRYGLAGRALHNLSVGLRVAREDAMALLWRVHERENYPDPTASPQANQPVATHAAAAAEAAGEDVVSTHPAGLTMPELLRMLGGGWRAQWVLLGLKRRQWATRLSGGRIALTEAGLAEARRLVHAHRLWETYLQVELGRPANAVDRSAHRIEHFLPAALAHRLDERLDKPAHDPHGSRIPR